MAPRMVHRAVLAVVGAVAFAGAAGACGGDDKSADKPEGQVVRFQAPKAKGPDPFTNAADVQGADRVQVETGSGPYGGTGSDLVCDRELLIKSLLARPDRLQAWARTVGIEPTPEAVSAYIRKLKPVTLTRDTRVTNHSFAGGRATAYQAILQAGTAVLVDEKGIPRARCRCGNPLLEPIYIPEAVCYGCPPGYEPPPPCDPFTDCYAPYPNPPPVTDADEPPDTTTTDATPPPEQSNPAASVSPAAGTAEQTFVLTVSGFPPNATLAVGITRPSGTPDNRDLTTDGSGTGTIVFPPDPTREIGTYAITVTDPGTGATASASTTVTSAGGGGGGGGEPPPEEPSATDPSGEQSDLPVCDPVDPVEPCREG